MLCQMHSETVLIPLEGRRGRAGECRDSVAPERSRSVTRAAWSKGVSEGSLYFPTQATVHRRNTTLRSNRWARRETRTEKPGAPRRRAVGGSLESCRDVLDLAWHALGFDLAASPMLDPFCLFASRSFRALFTVYLFYFILIYFSLLLVHLRHPSLCLNSSSCTRLSLREPLVSWLGSFWLGPGALSSTSCWIHVRDSSGNESFMSSLASTKP